jgi:hypothetical protein
MERISSDDLNFDPGGEIARKHLGRVVRDETGTVDRIVLFGDDSEDQDHGDREPRQPVSPVGSGAAELPLPIE